MWQDVAEILDKPRSIPAFSPLPLPGCIQSEVVPVEAIHQRSKPLREIVSRSPFPARRLGHCSIAGNIRVGTARLPDLATMREEEMLSQGSVSNGNIMLGGELYQLTNGASVSGVMI
jgi:hypothetical protein